MWDGLSTGPAGWVLEGEERAWKKDDGRGSGDGIDSRGDVLTPTYS